MVSSQRLQRGAYRRDDYNYLISNNREWNNCFIKITHRFAIFELHGCSRLRVHLPYLWSMVYELIWNSAARIYWGSTERLSINLKTLLGAANSLDYNFILSIASMPSLEYRRYDQSLAPLLNGPIYNSDLFQHRI